MFYHQSTVVYQVINIDIMYFISKILIKNQFLLFVTITLPFQNTVLFLIPVLPPARNIIRILYLSGIHVYLYKWSIFLGRGKYNLWFSLYLKTYNMHKHFSWANSAFCFWAPGNALHGVIYNKALYTISAMYRSLNMGLLGQCKRHLFVNKNQAP